MSLEMTVERLDPNSAVVAIHGSITLGTNLRIIDTNVQQLIAGGVARLVLDMSECPYSDSAGLGFLVHTYGLIAERGGSIRLCGVSDRVKELLTMTKTDGILPCDTDRQASLTIL